MTAVEWLIEKWHSGELNNLSWHREKIFEQAKQMEKDNSPKAENKDSFGEISDEEIDRAANNPVNDGYSFTEGAKWYREQLKNK